MSLSAKAYVKSEKSRLKDRRTLKEVLYEEGYEYVAGRLELLADEAGKLSPELACRLRLMPEEEFLQVTQHLTKGARWMAKRIWYGAEPDLRKLASDWAATKEIRAWADSKSEGYWAGLGIVDPAGQLRWHGFRFASDCDRFIALYLEVNNPDRVFNSSKQVSIGAVAAMANTANYNRLPIWVKRVIVRSNFFVPSFKQGRSGEAPRIGNIWRFIPCARAWKWCGELPKGIAEKVGKLSPRARVIAAIAWQEMEKAWVQDESRGERDARFWAAFQRCYKRSPLSLVGPLRDIERSFFDAFEVVAGLPYGTLERRSLKNYGDQELGSELLNFLSPEVACAHLLGCKGRATVEAFRSAKNREAIKWAGAIAYGRPDALQRFLAVEDCIAHQNDAVPFLQGLGWKSALRMIQKTTFRYRGETQQVSDYHVRDTGYLWNEIKEKPALGRVRCWFSLHEQLAATYVKEMPDGDVQVPSGWERIDGLCSVWGDWQIEIPRRVAQLKYWGQAFSNCVGGYGNAINSGRSIVFAVKEQGLLSHCVEVDPQGGRVRQFFSGRNQAGDCDLECSVVSALAQAGVINK